MPGTAAVIAISSQVARGSVGNRAMVFALERFGFEVWAVPTIILPHHPGHGRVERLVPDDSDFVGLLQSLQAGGRGADAIISGYFASVGQVHATEALVEAAKRRRPETLFLCDPVIGDAGGLYVDRKIAEAVRDRLLPLADAATPNAFECAWLAGEEEPQTPDLQPLGRRLPPPTILVTSAPALMRGQIGNLLVTGSEIWLFEHPLRETLIKGTGDLLAALLLARRLLGESWADAARSSLASVFEVLSASVAAEADELLLAARQAALVQPQREVAMRRLGTITPQPRP